MSRRKAGDRNRERGLTCEPEMVSSGGVCLTCRHGNPGVRGEGEEDPSALLMGGTYRHCYIKLWTGCTD
jgi:hypothetical protein